MNTGSIIRDLYTSGTSALPVVHFTFEQRLAELITDRVVQHRENEFEDSL